MMNGVCFISGKIRFYNYAKLLRIFRSKLVYTVTEVASETKLDTFN